MGGVFVRNEKLADYVIIEAKDDDQAHQIGAGLFDYEDNCPCCEYRWYDDFVDNKSADWRKFHMQSCFIHNMAECRVRFLDGHIEAYRILSRFDYDVPIEDQKTVLEEMKDESV